MPFDEPEENQDEAVMLPRRFGYPLPDEEDNETARIMQMAPTQAPSDEPGLQAETKPSIGQRIMHRA